MLNLLPPQQKIELHLDLLNQIIIRLGLTIIFMILILAVLLLVVRAFLNLNLEELKGELALWQAKPEIKEVEELEKKIKELNKDLFFLDGHQKKRVEPSLLLENLSRDVPSGIRFKTIYIKESQVNISGYAATRATLLSFRKTLENAPYVSNFNFPFSNLVKTRDIDFVLSFTYEK